jgi:hypothetical protein
VWFAVSGGAERIAHDGLEADGLVGELELDPDREHPGARIADALSLVAVEELQRTAMPNGCRTIRIRAQVNSTGERNTCSAIA